MLLSNYAQLPSSPLLTPAQPAQPQSLFTLSLSLIPLPFLHFFALEPECVTM